jgi:hypothetical protein
MLHNLAKSRVYTVVVVAFVIALVLPMFTTIGTAQAKAGDKITVGIITAKPASGLRGTWVIGGKTFTATAKTEFDQVEGPLVIGACAKAKIRNGVLKEIDSEPMRDCR